MLVPRLTIEFCATNSINCTFRKVLVIAPFSFEAQILAVFLGAGLTFSRSPMSLYSLKSKKLKLSTINL